MRRPSRTWGSVQARRRKGGADAGSGVKGKRRKSALSPPPPTLLPPAPNRSPSLPPPLSHPLAESPPGCLRQVARQRCEPCTASQNRTQGRRRLRTGALACVTTSRSTDPLPPFEARSPFPTASACHPCAPFHALGIGQSFSRASKAPAERSERGPPSSCSCAASTTCSFERSTLLPCLPLSPCVVAFASIHTAKEGATTPIATTQPH